MSHRLDTLLNTHGRQLSKADRKFVGLLMSELKQFEQYGQKDRALMFHPLNSYQRYLIHKATEVFPKLTSFSIDNDNDRRTIVCYKSKRKEQMRQAEATMPPMQRPPSSGKSPRESKGPRDNSRNKTMGHDSARGRPRHSDPEAKQKMGKYNTISNDAVKKRERGLDLEGPVFNGDLDGAKTDTEDPRRKKQLDYKQRHRARRSHSQPHLNDRPRARRVEDGIDDFADQRYSDFEDVRKPKRAVSHHNTPERKRSKAKPKYPLSVDQIQPAITNHVDDIHTFSETELSHQDGRVTPDDVENEIPPSYEKMSNESAKDRVKRNLKRIQRTNSTKSCPSLEQPKRDYVNAENRLLKSEKHKPTHQDSPVFPRKPDDTQPTPKKSDSPKKSKDRSKKNKKKTTGTARDEPARDYVNVPNEDLERRNSYGSSTFDSSWPGNPDSSRNGMKEVTAVIEKVPSASNINEAQVTPDINQKEPSRNAEEPSPSAPLAIDVERKQPVECKDSETQTDLQGSVVDVMMSTYNAHVNALNKDTTPTMSAAAGGLTRPTSLNDTSGVSTPSSASPASAAYERLGEYMYKAMLNFQGMLVENPLQPGMRTAVGPEPVLPTPIYTSMAHAAQPLILPWMPSFFPDLSAARYQSQPSLGRPCCTHQQANFAEEMRRPQMDSFASTTSSRDEPVHRHRSGSGRSRSGNSKGLKHVALSQPLQFSKQADISDSDSSSVNAYPELNAAEAGEGVGAYGRNSTDRSVSSTAGSLSGSANELREAGGDARASPLGHDNDDSFKRLPEWKSSVNSEEKDRRSKKSLAKNVKQTENKKDMVKNGMISPTMVDMEELHPLAVNAPIAKPEDEYDSSSSMSDGEKFASGDEDFAESSPLVRDVGDLKIADEDGNPKD